ncbi:DM13 domain-containing protein [Plectonema cf. radiosum LEGE 06105]|uniref:DM13 domain-containing protein n=1 Tax=Plectonema cf. radiosum LEGE 06105 TaxID=945769 RepID=A0A8J7EXG3_9CYAN|nr:DM13 domain-containing protein [Plectonema radiosum]MBE9211911.1 DM13 domain-containing protein [Plectonema cf. radiosum LEGE 06105]
MKFKYVAVLGMVVLLSVGCTNVESQAETQPQVETVAETPATASVQASGTFQDAEHPTKGTASIITENGKKYIQFDDQFKSDSGPDLFVILHKDDKLPITGIKEADYVTIAPLKSTSGTQKYEIPENVDLANFKSVAVWCRQFNATFGYAVLKA